MADKCAGLPTKNNLFVNGHEVSVNWPQLLNITYPFSTQFTGICLLLGFTHCISINRAMFTVTLWFHLYILLVSYIY